jgi:hypothetical protein
VVEVKTAVSFNWGRHCERRFFCNNEGTVAVGEVWWLEYKAMTS